MSSLRLARVDVRDVYLHKWHSHTRERVSDGQTRMAVGPSVHHRTLDAAAQRMNVLHQLPFAVPLNELERSTELARDVMQPTFDFSQSFRSIDRRLAHAEQVEIRTIDDRDPHDFFKPSSQALNC